MNKKGILMYGAGLVALCGLDLLWLGVIAVNFYQEWLGHLLGDPVWIAAIIFYFLYTFGVYYFAARNATSARQAGMLGALLGLIAYGTYDLTNQATVIEWPLMVTVVDMVWGMFITGAVACVMYSVGKRYTSPQGKQG